MVAEGRAAEYTSGSGAGEVVMAPRLVFRSAVMSRGDADMVDAASSTREVRRITLWGMALNLVLSAAKFVFGILASSQSLIADGVHSLSDMVTDVAVLIGAPFWSAPPDKSHPYGHGRIETLLTMVIGGILAGVGVLICYHAIVSIREPDQGIPGWSAFAVACVSIVLKELIYRWTITVGKRVRSSALIANAWHHRSDGFSSVPVAVAVLGMHLRPDLVNLDHIAAILVSMLILQAAWRIVWPALKELTDVGMGEEERKRLVEIVTKTEGVRNVHALRTRRVGSGIFVDLHVLVAPEISVGEGHDIAENLERRLLSEERDVVDVVVHVEPFEDRGGSGVSKRE